MSVLTPQLIDDLREWADRVRHEAGGPMLVAADRLEQLAASNAELLAACQKIADYYNTEASFDLMDAVDMCLEAVAHAQEPPP